MAELPTDDSGRNEANACSRSSGWSLSSKFVPTRSTGSSPNRARAEGVTYLTTMSGSSTTIRSFEFWTSDRKRASPALRGEVVGDLEALEGESDLPGEHVEALLEVPGERTGARHPDDTLQPLAHHDRGDDRPRCADPGQRPREPDLAAQVRGDLAGSHDGGVTYLELGPGTEIDLDESFAPAARELHRRLRPGTANLVAGLCDCERGSARLQRNLALGDMLVAHCETGEPSCQERREQNAREQRHPPNRLSGHDRLEARPGEYRQYRGKKKGQATAGRPRFGGVARLGEPPHARMQRHRAPGELRRDEGGKGQQRGERLVVDDRDRHGATGEHLGDGRPGHEPPLRPTDGRRQQEANRDAEERRAGRDAHGDAELGREVERLGRSLPVARTPSTAGPQRRG